MNEPTYFDDADFSGEIEAFRRTREQIQQASLVFGGLGADAAFKAAEGLNRFAKGFAAGTTDFEAAFLEKLQQTQKNPAQQSTQLRFGFSEVTDGRGYQEEIKVRSLSPEELALAQQALESIQNQREKDAEIELLLKIGNMPRGAVARSPKDSEPTVVDCIELRTGRICRHFRNLVEKYPDLYLIITPSPPDSNPDSNPGSNPGSPKEQDPDELLKRKQALAKLISEIQNTAQTLETKGEIDKAALKRIEEKRLTEAYKTIFKEEYEPPLPPLRPEPKREGSAVIELWLD